MASDGLSRVAEAVISGKIRVGRIYPHHCESRFRSNADMWRRNGKACSITGNLKFKLLLKPLIVPHRFRRGSETFVNCELTMVTGNKDQMGLYVKWFRFNDPVTSLH